MATVTTKNGTDDVDLNQIYEYLQAIENGEGRMEWLYAGEKAWIISRERRPSKSPSRRNTWTT